MTKVTSYTDFRARLAAHMQQVCDSGDVLHVTRQNAGGMVVMSEAEFASLGETAHLLRSPANARRLLTSIARANADKLKSRQRK